MRAVLCAVVAAIATAAAPALTGQAAAAVWTDQPHYSPGSTVTISGDNSDAAGYAAGETVEVLVAEPTGSSTSCSATADEAGAWSCQITLAGDATAIGGYTYTATGQSSGVSQGGTFSDAGCPSSNALGNQKEDPNVFASYTTSGNTAKYSLTPPNESSVGGIPGLIEYCVYTEPAPTSSAALYTNIDGAWAVDGGSGFFAFGRSDGNPDNVPFNGTTEAIGNATWKAGVPAKQTIVLHINDSAECSALYGGKVETCFVTPGQAVASPLKASKTAQPSFTRTFKWGIKKAAETTEIDNSGAATFHYTVSVTHDSGTDSGWQVAGEISVTNPNAAAVSGVAVTDAINDPAATCSVTKGTGVSIAALATAKLKYSCSYSAAPSSPSETNTATIAWSSQTLSDGSLLAAGSATGTAPVSWSGTTPTISEGSVVVTDPLGGGQLGTVSSTEASPKKFEYGHEFSTDPAGTCTSHENTATFKTVVAGEPDAEGSASVTVKHCVGADLTVQKTASPSFKRTFGWGVEKTAETAEIDNAGPATFKYKVSVSHDAGTDSGWVVQGTITVSNPNDWEAISLSGVADQIDNGGNCSITSGNATGTLAAGKSAQLGYECVYSSAPSAASFTNKATASWSAAAAHTPDGTASGTATGSFSSPTVVDGSATVTDPLGGGTLGTVSATESSPTVFEYSHEFAGDPAGTCTSHGNTATLKTNTSGTEHSASATVKHCVGDDPKVSKTASASFKRTFAWGIVKKAEPAEIDNAGPATFKYKVSVSHDAGTDSGWAVTGTITVTNPNDWEAVSLTGVADQIDNGGNCSITSGNPTATLPAGKSAQLGYECVYPSGPSAASFTNTATASWSATAAHTPDSTESGTATGAFGSPTVADGSVTVTDPLGGGTLGSASAGESSPTVFEYSHEFAGDPAGTCTSHENTATLKTNTSGTEHSASATVKHCVSSPPPGCTTILGNGKFLGTPINNYDDSMSTNLATPKEQYEISWESKLHKFHQTKLLSATCTISGQTKTFSGESLGWVDKVKGYRAVFTITLVGQVQSMTTKIYKGETLVWSFADEPTTKGKQTFS